MKSASYDYIVVGAGTAGCVLAARLSEDPSVRVLLLEAGKSDRDIRVRMPLAARPLWTHPGFNWGYQSEPEPNCEGRRIPVPRGKLLGGSSSINGMLYVRGHPRDYDQWRQLGAEGWSYEDVLPYFRRLETDWRGAGPYHGGSGPLRIVRNGNHRSLVPDFLAAANAAGFPASSDYNGAEPEGYAVPELNIDGGTRASSASVFLRPALRRANLTVETFAQATGVTIESSRAVGIKYFRAGQLHTVRAEREVVLCGGAYNSPQLLLLSGIGPADELKALSIAPVLDLPGVGHNLQDHASVGVDVACSKPVGFETELRLDRFVVSMVRWALLGTGPAASMPVICNGFIRTRPELERPDIQTLFTTSSPFARPWFPGIRRGKGHMFVARSVLLHPESRGRVTLASADPLARPRIAFNLLSTPTDRATLRESIRTTRAVFASEPFRSLCGAELLPGVGVKTDDEIDAYVRRTVATAFHGACTCAMGTGPDAVVDARLKVRGIEGLRVADASVMPVITGGNTNAPCFMIGEKVADLILGRAPLPAVPTA